jgi:predicted nuclease of predicted toxin-antitoxin system
MQSPGGYISGSNQVRLTGLDQSDDRAIWEFAKASDFILVSQDSDFADLAALYGPPPKVIWLRCGNQSTEFIEKLLREHSVEIAAFVAATGETCYEFY